MNETLQKQVEEKNKKIESEKKKDETMKNQPWIDHMCDAYKCCAICRKNFHRGILKVLVKNE
jgi:hypothetical protein